MQRVVPMLLALAVTAGALFFAGQLRSQAPASPADFVHFESAHVHPATLSPDGTHLFVVDTPDMRLSVYQVGGGTPVLEKEIPVGVEPVSVAARTDNEVWVVNHLSDDISIVDVAAGNVTRTLRVGDEPTDVVFAGPPGGKRAYVCVSQEDAVKIYDPADLTQPAIVRDIPGSDPRALAVNGDSTRVFCTVLESGNQTTVASFQEVVAGGGVPPAVPATDPALPDSPNVALILGRSGGNWVDEIGRNWNAAAPYTVTDWDLIIFDTGSRDIVGKAAGVGTLNFNAAWNPGNGRVYVTNTDALNRIRFEPNLRGRFYRNRVTIVDPAVASVVDTVHLNPHINYAVVPGPQSEKDQSLSQPCDIAWNPAGTRGYIAAFGSGLVGVIDPSGSVIGRIAVGGGPSGVVVDSPRNQLYVVNRFDNTVSTVNLATNSQSAVTPIGRSGWDPTPTDVRQGRVFQYDARSTSGHGDLACASCHTFSNFDNIAWDLGDPRGKFMTTSDPDFPTGQIDPFLEGFHPLKGPMTTQSLRGLATTQPFHWRGDRTGLIKFNGAFQSLLGNDRQLTAEEFALYESFIMSVHYPPNPNQNLDRTFKNAPVGQPSAARGAATFLDDVHDGIFKCVQCHTLPSGTNGQIINDAALGDDQDIKVPELRNLYEKTGFRDSVGAVNKRGFGYTHDGGIDNLFDFLKLPVFSFSGGDPQRRDLVAYLLSFDTGTAPLVGYQLTVNGSNKTDPGVIADANLLVTRFGAGDCDVIVKGVVSGEQRGYVLESDGLFHSDRDAEADLTPDQMRLLAANSGELTWTGVPPNTGRRAGIDRDRDGYSDRDEIDVFADPADPASTPANVAVSSGPAGRLAFSGARPNPFRSATQLSFQLPGSGPVRLVLYDLRGREIRVLIDGAYPAGAHAVPFDGRDARGARLGAGVYFARLDFAGKTASRPLVLTH